jgi:hypothetical protein
MLSGSRIARSYLDTKRTTIVTKLVDNNKPTHKREGKVCDKDYSTVAGKLANKSTRNLWENKNNRFCRKKCPCKNAGKNVLLLCRYLSTLRFSGMDFEHSFGLLSSLPTLPLLGQETQVCLSQLKYAPLKHTLISSIKVVNIFATFSFLVISGYRC